MNNKSDSDNSLFFGTRPVLEALEEGMPLERVFLVKGSSNEIHRRIVKLAKQQGVPVKLVPLEKLQRLTRKNHQGVVAFSSPVEFHHLETLLPQLFEQGKMPFIVVLDGVTDVRNFGAIARSAECFGVDAILISMHHSAPINGEAVKSSAGALLRIPVCRTNDLVRSLNFLSESGLRLVGATEKAARAYHDVDYNLPYALVMGAEDTGLSDEVWDRCDAHIKIPMGGQTASLNVSVAAGIIICEAAQQRLAASQTL